MSRFQSLVLTVILSIIVGFLVIESFLLVTYLTTKGDTVMIGTPHDKTIERTIDKSRSELPASPRLDSTTDRNARESFSV